MSGQIRRVHARRAIARACAGSRAHSVTAKVVAAREVRRDGGAPRAGADDGDRSGHACRDAGGRDRALKAEHLRDADEARLAVAVPDLDPARDWRSPSRAVARLGELEQHASARRETTSGACRRGCAHVGDGHADDEHPALGEVLARPSRSCRRVAHLGPSFDRHDHLERRVAAEHEQRLGPRRGRVVEDRRGSAST